jgi:hypothetical protein
MSELPEKLRRFAQPTFNVCLGWHLVEEDTELVCEPVDADASGPSVKVPGESFLVLTYGYRAFNTKSPDASGTPVYDLKVQIRVGVPLLEESADAAAFLQSTLHDAIERDFGDMIKMWVKAGAWCTGSAPAAS